MLSKGDVVDMEQQCLKQITKAMANWSTADVRTVPRVMYQIRCGDDDDDQTLEYQINWFIDCAETYVHNHRHSFDTFCLDGEYTEKLWDIVDDHTDAITYQFYRTSGNVFDAPVKVAGRLCHVMTRQHFPGNLMHVNITQYHSIAANKDADTRVLTFLAKRKHSPTPDMYVLSSSPAIDAPKEEIRPATEDERQNIYAKLQQILRTRFQQ
jgi:hypothetical protein